MLSCEREGVVILSSVGVVELIVRTEARSGSSWGLRKDEGRV